MRWPLLALATLSGCVFPFCGPTIYQLTAVTASTTFDEPWDSARIDAGLRAAGFEPRRASAPEYVTASGHNETVYVDGEPNGTRLAISFVTREQGERDEVERRADEIIAERETRVAHVLDAFAQAANWTADASVSWDKGMLHGDC